MNRVLISSEGVDPPIFELRIIDYVLRIMQSLHLDNTEVSILFCDDEFIQSLNKEYRGIDSPTDVLSFENGDKYTSNGCVYTMLGDIIISCPMLKQNAKYFETDVTTELRRLLIHAILHLKGMDHNDEHIERGKPPACEMLVLQEQLLSTLE